MWDQCLDLIQTQFDLTWPRPELTRLNLGSRLTKLDLGLTWLRFGLTPLYKDLSQLDSTYGHGSNPLYLGSSQLSSTLVRDDLVQHMFEPTRLNLSMCNLTQFGIGPTQLETGLGKFDSTWAKDDLTRSQLDELNSTLTWANLAQP